MFPVQGTGEVQEVEGEGGGGGGGGGGGYILHTILPLSGLRGLPI